MSFALFPCSERCSLKSCPVWELTYCAVQLDVPSVDVCGPGQRIKIWKPTAQRCIKINHSLPWVSTRWFFTSDFSSFLITGKTGWALIYLLLTSALFPLTSGQRAMYSLRKRTRRWFYSLSKFTKSMHEQISNNHFAKNTMMDWRNLLVKSLNPHSKVFKFHFMIFIKSKPLFASFYSLIFI